MVRRSDVPMLRCKLASKALNTKVKIALDASLFAYFFFASAGFTGVVLMRSTIFFVTSGFAFR